MNTKHISRLKEIDRRVTTIATQYIHLMENYLHSIIDQIVPDLIHLHSNAYEL